MKISTEQRRDVRMRWVLANVKCTNCAGGLTLSSTNCVACERCGVDYGQRRGPLNFISEADRKSYGIAPTTNVSAHKYDQIALKIIEQSDMVLDCGSGRKDVSFANLVQCEVVEYPNVDVLAVNQALPFQDACFDAVLSLDVLEHVDQPFDCAAELLRVLKPGGKIYCNVPFLQREHGYPHHYFGMTRMGIRRLFGDHIEIDQHKVPMSGHPIWALWMMLQTYRDGLPGELTNDFHQLRVADILDKNPADWIDDPLVQQLNEEARWRIATTTSLVATKRDIAG